MGPWSLNFLQDLLENGLWFRADGLGFRDWFIRNTVDDLNPALPIIRNRP